MKFRVDNGKFQHRTGLGLRMLQAISRLPDGELVTIKSLANTLNVLPSTLYAFAGDIPENNFVREKNNPGKTARKFYGNPKTVKACRAHWPF